MKNRKISVPKAAGAYIGTIVGAGFATGQEVLQFLCLSLPGILGIALSTFLFIVFGFLIMELGMKLDAKSHLEIIRHASGSFFGKIIDFIITFFLFGALTAMLAGTGALFSQQFGISSLAGSIFMAVITLLTVLTGIHGVINSISYVVPFLLAAVAGVSIFSIINSPPQITTASLPAQSNLITNWFLAAVLYTSYNTVISISVLGPLGDQADNKKTVFYGSVLGGLGLGAGSFLIFLALSGNISEAARLEVPMVYIAGKISPFMQTIYAVVLIAEIYTTAVGSLYGLSARLSGAGKNPAKNKTVAICASIFAFFASCFGFSNLVKYLYPLVGYGGIILLASLIFAKVKNKIIIWKQ